MLSVTFILSVLLLAMIGVCCALVFGISDDYEDDSPESNECCCKKLEITLLIEDDQEISESDEALLSKNIKLLLSSNLLRNSFLPPATEDLLIGCYVSERPPTLADILPLDVCVCMWWDTESNTFYWYEDHTPHGKNPWVIVPTHQ